jgi:hypothetical protein
MRPVAVVAALGLLAAASPAHAGRSHARACNLIRDKRGDATGPFGQNLGPSLADPAVDVLSADIATNASRLTAVIRVAGDPRTAATSSPSGRYWFVHFSVAGHDFEAFADSGLATGGYGVREVGEQQLPGAHNGTGSLSNGAVSITVPLTALRDRRATVRAGSSLFTGLAAVSGRTTDTGPADLAPIGDPYRAGTPSCVKIGS